MHQFLKAFKAEIHLRRGLTFFFEKMQYSNVSNAPHETNWKMKLTRKLMSFSDRTNIHTFLPPPPSSNKSLSYLKKENVFKKLCLRIGMIKKKIFRKQYFLFTILRIGNSFFFCEFCLLPKLSQIKLCCLPYVFFSS